MLEPAGYLHCLGLPIDVHRINHGHEPGIRLMALCNLPEYPFEHSKKYSHESHISKGLRLRSQPRLDVLSKTVLDWNPLEARWRHFLRVSELPWTEHHKVLCICAYDALGANIK